MFADVPSYTKMFGHLKGLVVYLGTLEDVDSSKPYHKITVSVRRECTLWYHLEEAAAIDTLFASDSSTTDTEDPLIIKPWQGCDTLLSQPTCDHVPQYR